MIAVVILYHFFQYLPQQLAARKEVIFQNLAITPFTWVDTLDQLQLLSSKLEKVDEFAIDIEAHAYRSYQGFCCLLQISTRKEDFIVDLFSLRNQVHILNGSFTNPAIVKVLHGGDNDIVWLQRDHGLYIVNLFDTGQASRVLCYPKLSLSYLLERFCDVSSDKKKQFQLADWRIRPIPEDMMEYARSDTHYLLYIYDRVHNELVEKGQVLPALNNSRLLCQRVYDKEMFQPTLASFQLKCPSLNKTQSAVLQSLFEWRDFFARQEDESIRFILPNHMLIKIAELLPQDSIELFSCCNPQPPPFIKTNAHDVIKVIKDAQEGKPILLEFSKLTQPIQLPFLHEKASSTPLPVPSKAVEDQRTANKDLTQTELFQQADWLQSSARRTAALDPINNVSHSSASSTARFFGSPASAQKGAEAKLAQVNQSLASAFSFDLSAPLKVPESMEEIFQFSNANRKRNKEKKRLKEDSINAGPVSPIKMAEVEPTVAPKAKQEDPREFMKNIGWLDPSLAPLIAPKATPVVAPVEASTKEAAVVEPYDYSKHRSSNYGLKKATEPVAKKPVSEDQTEVSVPSFGKASSRVRTAKPTQRTQTSSTRGRGRGSQVSTPRPSPSVLTL